MISTTLPSTSQPGHHRPGQPRLAAQLANTLAAEWTKLRSLRSTVVALLATVVVCVGFAILLSYATINQWDDQMSAGDRADFAPAASSVSGIIFGQLVIGALGVLALSAEYSTGTIRATLSATPQRLVSYLTKIVVFAATGLAVAVASTTTAFLVSQAILRRRHLGVGLADPGSARIVIGSALFLVAVGLLGLGLAALLRHPAGAISSLVGLMLVLPLLANFLPGSWQDQVHRWLPLYAGGSITDLHPDPDSFAPWTGLGVLYGYAVLALLGGAAVLLHRDA